MSNAQLFSRICGKDVHILEATASFAEKAASIDSTSSTAMAEVGRQCLLRGRTKEAQKYYKVINVTSFSSISYCGNRASNRPKYWTLSNYQNGEQTRHTKVLFTPIPLHKYSNPARQKLLNCFDSIFNIRMGDSGFQIKFKSSKKYFI